jgi:O-antigen/teichoic acid export membrane protein
VLKRLASDVVIYGLSSALARSVGLLLLPLLARHLTPAEYGTAELLAVCFVLANLVLPLEVTQAVARFFGDAAGPREREDYAWTAFWFTAGVFAALVLVVGAAPEPLARALLGSEEYADVLRIAALAMGGQALLYVVQGQLRWALQPLALAVLNLCAAAVAALAAVVLVGLLHGGLAGYIAGQALAAWAVLPLGIALAARKTTFRMRVRLPVLREMLAFSAPLVMSGIAVYATGYADRWLVQAWLGLDELGLYAAGARIASVVAVALAGFQLAVTPLVYRHYREPETPALLKRVFEYFLAAALPGVALLAAFAPELARLLGGPAFAASGDVVGWLALGIVLANVYLFAPGLAIVKATGRIAMLNVAGAAVNLVLAIVALPVLGRLGAALAFAAGSACVAALYFILGQRHYPVPHRLGYCTAALAVLVVFLVLLQAAPLPLAWRALGCALACAAMALLLIERTGRRQAPATT